VPVIYIIRYLHFRKIQKATPLNLFTSNRKLFLHMLDNLHSVVYF